MCLPKSMPAPAPPPPPKEPPRQVDEASKKAYDEGQQQARAAAGRSGSILTDSSLSKTEPEKAKRTVLG